MDKHIYLCLTITYFVESSMANSCSINTVAKCYHTVNCENPAIIHTIIPYCDYTDPYVTLVLRNSPVQTITANFFITNFDYWVRIITADENNWTAIQNFAFSNFKNVLYIDLSDNNINEIGSAFKGLKELDSLNLSRNHLEIINPGIFRISKNKNKIYLLDLSYNYLTYLSRDMLRNLPNLKKLYLQGNKIATLGFELSRYLNNLDFLNLCYNNLRMFNLSNKYLTTLRELNLSFNKLKIFNVSGLESLEMINLSHNDIKKLEFNYFEQSPNLVQVDLSYNKLMNISFNKHPQQFHDKYNEDIRKPFMEINLNNNNIAYIDKNFFVLFDHMRYLNLAFNNITEFSPGTFEHVKILKTLNVSNCKLNLTEETFRGLKKTEIIDLTNNNLFELQAIFFKDCVALKKIKADKNKIKFVDIQQFTALVPTLTRITLIGNPDDCTSFNRLGKLFFIIILLAVIISYVSVHRKIIFVYTLKCRRCLILRKIFYK